jgi:hypothetical protein
MKLVRRGYQERADMDAEGLALHVARASRRDHQLLSDLLVGAWPGGPADRTAPVAREWLRRWTAQRLMAAPATCRCPEARCACSN